MLKKHLLTLSMAIVMVALIGIMESDIAYAKTTKASINTANDDMKEELEKVLKIVKQKVTIPSECTVFEYFISTNNDSSILYNMFWRDINYQSSCNIIADENGNIISYENNCPTDAKVSYLKSELEKEAEKAIEKLNPVMKGHIKLASSSYSRYGCSYARNSNSYQFKFDRVENKIPMDNYATVSINVDTKEVVSFNTDWLFDVEVPAADIQISKEEAKKLVKKKLKMELKYFPRYDYGDNDYTKSAFLAYVPNTNYISVDAKTGEIDTTMSEWKGRNSSYDTINENVKPTVITGEQLTEKEISKLNILDQLISKEDAVKIITENKNIYLESTATSISSYLSNYGDNYYWNIFFNDPRQVDDSSEDTYRAHAYTVIDAKTGVIISYDASVNENKQPHTLKPIDGCQRKFEAFVNSQDKEMMTNVKLDKSEENDNPVVIKKEDTRATTFNYYRVNEGVVYEDNYFYGGVDRGTGKIYRYHYYWDKGIKFESPKGTISAEEALDYYLGLPGFDIKYEENSINTYGEVYDNAKEYYDSNEAKGNSEIRLVYNNTSISLGLISPFTGKELDYDGKVNESNEKAYYSYTDIANHPYERSILLLSDIVLGYKNDIFRPDDFITKEEFIEFFEGFVYGYAWSVGENLITDYHVTRQQAARFTIEVCGLAKIAKLDEIYETGYTDEATIAQDAIGCVALCKGLNLLQFGKDNSLGPNEKLTRGEAAKLVIDYFNLFASDKSYYIK